MSPTPPEGTPPPSFGADLTTTELLRLVNSWHREYETELSALILKYGEYKNIPAENETSLREKPKAKAALLDNDAILYLGRRLDHFQLLWLIEFLTYTQRVTLNNAYGIEDCDCEHLWCEHYLSVAQRKYDLPAFVLSELVNSLIDLDDRKRG